MCLAFSTHDGETLRVLFGSEARERTGPTEGRGLSETSLHEGLPTQPPQGTNVTSEPDERADAETVLGCE